MARLPQPGGDKGEWGTILNQFLAVEHNADGSLKASGSMAEKAPINNPTFTGTVTVPEPVNTSDAATKDYVDNTASAGTPDADGSTKGKLQLTGDLGGTADNPTVPGLAEKAPINNPTFTGNVTVPTPITPTDAVTKAYADDAMNELPELIGGRGINVTPVSASVHSIDFDNIQVDVYDTPGTQGVQVPSWARLFHYTLIGGGGGGGGGRRGAAGTIRGGGGGGQAGGIVSGWARVENLSISSGGTTIVVGAGGGGGTGGSSDDTNGSAGSAGTVSQIFKGLADPLAEAMGGAGGGGGSDTDGGAGGGLTPFSGTLHLTPNRLHGAPGLRGGGVTAGQSLFFGLSGMDFPSGPYTATGITYESLYRTLCRDSLCFGGGGGGFTAADANSDPSSGSGGGVFGGGAAGTLGSKNGSDGSAASLQNSSNHFLPGGGGGGGYQSTSGAAGTGGAGIGYGGAGGGGGASLNGNAAGTGGAGSNGAIRFIWVA